MTFFSSFFSHQVIFSIVHLVKFTISVFWLLSNWEQDKQLKLICSRVTLVIAKCGQSRTFISLSRLWMQSCAFFIYKIQKCWDFQIDFQQKCNNTHTHALYEVVYELNKFRKHHKMFDTFRKTLDQVYSTMLQILASKNHSENHS